MDDMSLTEALDLADLTSPMPTLAGRALKRLRAHLEMLREVDVDRKRLLHALDVALNGEDGAAPAPGLADLLAQVQQAVRTRGAPLLVDRRQPALDEAAKRIRNTLLADGRNEQVALFDQLLTEHQRAAQVFRQYTDKATGQRWNLIGRTPDDEEGATGYAVEFEGQLGWVAADGHGVVHGSNQDLELADFDAASAQNAQGDAVDVAVTAWNESAFTGGASLRERLSEVVRAVLHAERARVPEGMAEALEALRPFANAYHRLRSYGDNPTDETPLYAYFGEGHPLYELLDGEHGPRLTVQSLEKAAAALAAAPSQRAEVKP